MPGTTIAGPKAQLLQVFKTRKGQNTKVETHVSKLRFVHSILGGSPNECWLHTCNACVITSSRLGLRAPLVARNKFFVLKDPPLAQNAKAASFGSLH